MSVAAEMPTVMAKARGQAKRNLIAQAAVVARELHNAATRVSEHIDHLKAKSINEWEMVEAIHNEVFTLPHELNLTSLVAKLVVFQLSDNEARRTMIDVGRRFGLLEEEAETVEEQLATLRSGLPKLVEAFNREWGGQVSFGAAATLDQWVNGLLAGELRFDE